MWGSRYLIAFNAIFVAFGVGCIVNGNGNAVAHGVCVAGQLLLLTLNVSILRKHKERNHAATNNQSGE